MVTSRGELPVLPYQVTPPCRGNFSPCEQKAKVAPGVRVVSYMLIIKVQNKFQGIKVPESNRSGQLLVKLILCNKLCHDYRNRINARDWTMTSLPMAIKLTRSNVASGQQIII